MNDIIRTTEHITTGENTYDSVEDFLADLEKLHHSCEDKLTSETSTEDLLRVLLDTFGVMCNTLLEVKVLKDRVRELESK